MYFIAFEGLDKSGKSTQLAALSLKLRTIYGLKVVECREPGSTALGEECRKLLLNFKGKISPVAELMLMNASRAELTYEVLDKYACTDTVVLTDRWTPSTFAYQGFGRGVNLDDIKSVCNVATRINLTTSDDPSNKFWPSCYVPDLTIFFSLSYEDRLKRVKPGEPMDRFEGESGEFLRRVASTYMDAASFGSEKLTVIDATRPVDDITNEILNKVAKELALESV